MPGKNPAVEKSMLNFNPAACPPKSPEEVIVGFTRSVSSGPGVPSPAEIRPMDTPK